MVDRGGAAEAATSDARHRLEAAFARGVAASDDAGARVTWNPTDEELDARHLDGLVRVSPWVDGTAKDLEDARAAAEASGSEVVGVKVCTARTGSGRRFVVWAYGFAQRGALR